MSSPVLCNKETGICPFPLPLTRAGFDSIVKQQRDAIVRIYTEEREAFIDERFGSTREERAQDSAAQKEADIAHLTRFHPKYGQPDPFAAPWLPPQCPVTVPRFPHNEMLMAKNGVKALEPAEGRHLREFIAAGHRLLAIPYEELVSIPFMDAWLFKYALSRFFAFEDAARWFLRFRDAVRENEMTFCLTDEVRKYITVGAVNPLPQHVEAVSKGLLLDEVQPTSAVASFPTQGTECSSPNAHSSQPIATKPWPLRTPVTLMRPRMLRWEEVPVEAYCRSLFYYQMNVVALDWLVQVQGIVTQTSVKKVGAASVNRRFMNRFHSRSMKQCLPAKAARGYLANEGFLLHSVVYPMMKLFLSAKVMAKSCFLGKDYGVLLAELGPERAMEECGGSIKLSDDGALALALLEALRWE